MSNNQTKTAAVAIDTWKLAIFKRHLDNAKREYTEGPGFTSGTLLLKVKYEWVADLPLSLKPPMPNAQGPTMDNTGLSQVGTSDLAQRLYGACITGDVQAASVFAAVLALRYDGAESTRKVFATNCTTSGRSERAFPRIKE